MLLYNRLASQLNDTIIADYTMIRELFQWRFPQFFNISTFFIVNKFELRIIAIFDYFSNLFLSIHDDLFDHLISHIPAIIYSYNLFSLSDILRHYYVAFAIKPISEIALDEFFRFLSVFDLSKKLFIFFKFRNCEFTIQSN